MGSGVEEVELKYNNAAKAAPAYRTLLILVFSVFNLENLQMSESVQTEEEIVSNPVLLEPEPETKESEASESASLEGNDEDDVESVGEYDETDGFCVPDSEPVEKEPKDPILDKCDECDNHQECLEIAEFIDERVRRDFKLFRDGKRKDVLADLASAVCRNYCHRL